MPPSPALDPLERALADPPPVADAGFTRAVLDRLPPRPRRRPALLVAALASAAAAAALLGLPSSAPAGWAAAGSGALGTAALAAAALAGTALAAALGELSAG